MLKKAQIKKFNQSQFLRTIQMQPNNKFKGQLSSIINTRTITTNHSLFNNIQMIQNNLNKKIFSKGLLFQEKEIKNNFKINK